MNFFHLHPHLHPRNIIFLGYGLDTLFLGGVDEFFIKI